MPKPNLFVDSGALFAGVVSASGAARALLILAESGQIAITVSEQVVAETERAVARKAPMALPYYREALRAARPRIVRDPSSDEVDAHSDIIHRQSDAPIVVAATKTQADYLVTLNRRHFLEDSGVAVRSGLRIGTPGDALAWVRGRLAQEDTAPTPASPRAPS